MPQITLGHFYCAFRSQSYMALLRDALKVCCETLLVEFSMKSMVLIAHYSLIILTTLTLVPE